MYVNGNEGLGWFSFTIGALDLEVIITSVRNDTFNNSLSSVTLDSCREALEWPDKTTNCVFGSEWNSDCLADSENEAAWIFDNKADSSCGGFDNWLTSSVILKNFEENLLRSEFGSISVLDNNWKRSRNDWNTWKYTVWISVQRFR